MAQFTINIDENLKRKIEKEASKNGRSRTKEIERILREFFDAKK